MNSIPVALSIAGSDSSAGAGIQADLKAFTARGVYGVTAVTCVVSETPGKVHRLTVVDAKLVADQIDLLLTNFPVAAIKTGLLCNAEIVAAVARSLRRLKRLKLVVDPVMIATSGDPLLNPEAIETYERQLFPLATLITPNLDEAARLLRCSTRNVAEMRRAADQLAQKYSVPVLLKGGHLRQGRAIDILQFERRRIEFGAAAVPGVRTHGTGCTYSAAIAAELAKGAQLIDAIRIAKRVVTAAIRQHFAWRRGAQKIEALNQSARRC